MRDREREKKYREGREKVRPATGATLPSIYHPGVVDGKYGCLVRSHTKLRD